jgi:hypothetical protein
MYASIPTRVTQLIRANQKAIDRENEKNR